jgi:hypothetical protein
MLLFFNKFLLGKNYLLGISGGNSMILGGTVLRLHNNNNNNKSNK